MSRGKLNTKSHYYINNHVINKTVRKATSVVLSSKFSQASCSQSALITRWIYAFAHSCDQNQRTSSSANVNALKSPENASKGGILLKRIFFSRTIRLFSFLLKTVRSRFSLKVRPCLRKGDCSQSLSIIKKANFKKVALCKLIKKYSAVLSVTHRVQV